MNITPLIDWWKELTRRKTCVPDGCGYQEPNIHDSKCLICRLPMGEITEQNERFRKWQS